MTDLVLSLNTLAQQINDRQAQIEDAVGQALLRAREAGELLIEAKKQVGHGKWLPWLEANCTVSASMAEIEADLQVDPDRLWPGCLPVDAGERLLRRFFTRGSFESGGRLFGGFWQRMPKDLRRRAILIDAEEVACLDYGQMAPRILYGLAGQTLVAQDAYTLPGLEGCRAGVKKVMNAVLFAEAPLTRFPKDTRSLFPRRVNLSQVVAALEQTHAPIRSAFFTGIGHRLQFVESQILVEVLRGRRSPGGQAGREWTRAPSRRSALCWPRGWPGSRPRSRKPARTPLPAREPRSQRRPR